MCTSSYFSVLVLVMGKEGVHGGLHNGKILEGFRVLMFFQVNVVQIVGHNEEKRNVAVKSSSPSS